ncbi:Coenzyme F420 hydrogenase subunit beta [ANME-1 cluster archaeon GoMg1]|nr:Coenzyme F420 hydrogenase subunit beta [ANME-1 cluster archaeon GoMg1]
MVKHKGNITDLEREVIYNGLCCYCGSCGAFCKEYITYENEIPVTKKKCHEIYGACYDFCPRTFFAPFEVERAVFGELRTDNLLGYYQGDIITARATDEAVREHAQDGGVVSALLVNLLEQGEIDAAVVSKTAENWKPEPFVATKKEDVLATAGSKYTQCPSVSGVGDALEQGYKNVALVGLPCHIQGMRKVQMSTGFDVGADRVKLLIGLMCSETFDMSSLENKLVELGTSIEDVEKFNIKKGRFIVHTKAGKEIKTPIKLMRDCMREACGYCYDFAAEFADLSVGSIGSEFGWSTVITRSKAGVEIVKKAEAAGAIETKKLSKEQVKEVRKLASFKKRGNLKNIYDKCEPVEILNMEVELEMLEQFLDVE